MGRAWRLKIPKHLLFRATLNMLEFLACVICPWIDIIEKNIPPLSCFLSMTDSSTSAGWLRKSNFLDDDEKEVHLHCKLDLARSHARRVLDSRIKDYSQWFPGAENDVADSLSRDFHLSNEKLLSLFNTHIPSQIPKNLKISPLPTEIESWVYAWLQRLPESQPPQEIHQMSKLALGGDGSPSLVPSASKATMGFSKNSNHITGQSCSEPSPTPCEKENILKRMSIPWLLAQSEIPSTTWHRCSGTANTRTPGSTSIKTLADFYSNSTKAIKRQILQKNAKKQSRSQ